MLDKDDVLARIKKLEQEQTELEKTKREAKEQLETLTPEYEKLLKEFEEVERALKERQRSIQEATRRGISARTELADAKRELSRMLENERIDDEFRAQREAFREKTLAAIYRAENRDDGMGAYRHQIEGGIHLAVTKRALLGDKRGLGKTLTSLIFADLVDAQRIIIVTASDLMRNVAREVRLWAPHRNVYQLGKMTPGERDFMYPVMENTPQWVVILSYSSWRKDDKLIDLLINLKADMLINDEAQDAKDMKTITAQGLKKLALTPNTCPECKDNPHWLPEAVVLHGWGNTEARCTMCGHFGPITDFTTIQYVLPMTGTVIMNKPQDLFPHLHIIDPIHFPIERAFLREFCRQDPDSRRWGWAYGGQKRLMDRIGPRYLARTKEDTDVVIPPSTPVPHEISIEEMKEKYPNQWRAYEQGRKYAQIVLDPAESAVNSMPNKFVVYMRLRQILVWPNIELEYTDPEKPDRKFHMKLDVKESIKLDKAEELITQIVEEGDRPVLYSMFQPGLHELKERLNKKGIRTAVYDGTTSERTKELIELDFDRKTADIGNYKWDALLCNYRSAGRGLNFTTATDIIKLDRNWNHANEDQAAGRAERIGAVRDVNVHDIMVEPSIDSYMAQLVDEKRELSEGFESEARSFRDAYDALMNGEI